ncbi:hypothetical protein [Sulfurospirillum barnesii]|uniref:Uncharacterized protein n=1 Tax=Sulfurospirillum barnesii (strain ATCC 700032 / DSM 10660 / SES-3) TaxID=760154 RepID=I3Y0A7_SULBS|nr:hypothetical protein [Sulfurospirillum barnesii]AFL69631.1 hypothetical protein Sulba_2363 [Sulfurospirillum barnesii SES-3]
MSNEKYIIKELSLDEMLDELNGTSPLNMSKKLMEYELFDQQSSIEILEQIYKEFESKEKVIDNLVTPMLLNIFDGLIKHPKLEGTFRKTNITPSRLVNDVNSFSYKTFKPKQTIFNHDFFLRQGEKAHYSPWTRMKFYDTKPRSTTEEEKGLVRDTTITYEDKNGEIKTITTTTVIDNITGETLDLTIAGAKQKDIKTSHMDHINPISKIREDNKNNPYLYRDDLEKLVGLPENESYINASLNISKNDMSWSEYIEKNPNKLTPEEQQKALELEKKANEAQKNEARKLMAKNIGLDALGDVIIFILKPIWFEIKDMFTHGILGDFASKTKNKFEAFLLRIKRAYNFIKENILHMLGENLQKIMENFIGILISALIQVCKGIFQKIVQIISDGYLALKEALKIILKDKDENGNIISPAQKADAIVKIVASAIVPILIFSFEQTLSKIPIIGDIATIIVSGLATTLVVWVLDEIDLFSVKSEKRLMRVKEIFELRIETIKKNTDIFEKASIEVLAKQKLQFKKIASDMHHAIENNLNVNNSVYQMANFMHIDLQAKSTDEFLALLSSKKQLVI